MKKPVISNLLDQPSAKPEARVPFFAKTLDQETLRSVRAGEDEGLMAKERVDKLAQNG